jgi:hypothetical protein
MIVIYSLHQAALNSHISKPLFPETR